jgi:NifU-like protein involved in Fe-S cluster formation
MEGGRVADFAQDVKACALGQAAAAVMGEHVIGADRSRKSKVARDALRAMLKTGGPPPRTVFGPRHARAGERLSAAPRLDAARVRGDGGGVPAPRRPNRAN